jgi:hypothetical protein
MLPPRTRPSQEATGSVRRRPSLCWPADPSPEELAQ